MIAFHGDSHCFAEHPQSAARDPGLSTGTDFIASPLHCLVRYFLSLGGVTDQSLSESRHQHRQDHDRRESPDRGDARGIAPPASADWRHQRLIHRPADEHAQTGNRSRTQSARDDTGVATHGGTYGRCECVFWLALFSALQQIQPNHDGNEYAQCRDHNRRHNEISIVDEEFHRSTSTLANNLIEPHSVRSNTVIDQIMPHSLANGKPGNSGAARAAGKWRLIWFWAKPLLDGT